MKLPSFGIILLLVLMNFPLYAQEPVLLTSVQGRWDNWEIETYSFFLYSELDDNSLCFHIVDSVNGYGTLEINMEMRHGDIIYDFYPDIPDSVEFPLKMISPYCFIDNTGIAYNTLDLDEFQVVSDIALDWIYPLEYAPNEESYLMVSRPDLHGMRQIILCENGILDYRGEYLFDPDNIEVTKDVRKYNFTFTLDNTNAMVLFKSTYTEALSVADTLYLPISDIPEDRIIDGSIVNAFFYSEYDIDEYYFWISEINDRYAFFRSRPDFQEIDTSDVFTSEVDPRFVEIPFSTQYFKSFVPVNTIGCVTHYEGRDHLCWLDCSGGVQDYPVEGEVTKFKFETLFQDYVHGYPDPGGNYFYALWSEYAEEDDVTSLYIMEVERILSIETTAENSQPTEFSISPAYPNPFNPSTQITVNLRKSQEVNIAIFDVLGRNVCQLKNGTMQAGSHLISWNGLDNGGSLLSSGKYFCVVKTPHGMVSESIILLK